MMQFRWRSDVRFCEKLLSASLRPLLPPHAAYMIHLLPEFERTDESPILLWPSGSQRNCFVARHEPLYINDVSFAT